MTMTSMLRYSAFTAATLCLLQSSVSGQDIPRDQYLRYMPLEYPRLVRQTPASETLEIYGNPKDPAYRDAEPLDGIDDRRGELLKSLGVRFAPYMVMNTTSFPMDFKKFMDQKTAFLLHVDRWNVAATPPDRTEERTIDFVTLSENPCPVGPIISDDPGYEIMSETGQDCELLELLREFHPNHPTNPWYTSAAVEPTTDPFTVMYFNFPGDSPETWQAEYVQTISRATPRKYQDYGKAYLHPFIAEVQESLDGLPGYELILQYWFFYPFNDGGNNHEGDWEHMNVVASPLSAMDRPLTAAEVSALLQRSPSNLDGADPVLIKRLEYYFHQNVMILDFLEPSVYQPRDAWEREVKERNKEFVNESWLWKQMRAMAYKDANETQFNTHPIGFIGADNKGLDQLLEMPGGKNRDSHGTYPFTGMYKNIGPAGATEQINARFDLREYYADPEGGFPRNVKSFADPERIEIVPDWERIVDLAQESVEVRRNWSWLILPIRWGYPASVSPFAGVVAHAETGNLAPVGPGYSTGWNTPGASQSFSVFEPHKYNTLFPLGVQDSFVNSWGFLNAVTLVTVLPPIDFLWRVVAAPVKAAVKPPDPVFFPTDQVPMRFLSLNGGVGIYSVPEDMNLLFFENDVIFQVLGQLLAIDSSFVSTGTPLSQKKSAPVISGSLYLGKRLVTTTSLTHFRTPLGFDVTSIPMGNNVDVRGDLNFWQVAGKLRYTFTSAKFQPYASLGYGWVWYRLEDIYTQDTTTGEAPVPLDNPNGSWIHRPWSNPDGSSNAFANLWPNMWTVGAGFEFIPIANIAPPPKGIDVSLIVDVSLYNHDLGIQQDLAAGLTLEGGSRDVGIHRPAVNFLITVSF